MMKRRVEACDLRQVRMRIGDRLNQRDRGREVIGRERDQAPQSGENVRRDALRLVVVGAAVHDAMPDRGQRSIAALTGDPLEKVVDARLTGVARDVTIAELWTPLEGEQRGLQARGASVDGEHSRERRLILLHGAKDVV